MSRHAVGQHFLALRHEGLERLANAGIERRPFITAQHALLGVVDALRRILLSTISRLVTIILAVIFLGEEFTFIDAIGTALIILGAGFYAWSDARAARTPAAEN